MPNDTAARAAELRQMMHKHGWSIEDVAAMLPIKGRPRKYLTIKAWLQPSQEANISSDCIEVLRLRVRLAKCEKKLEQALAHQNTGQQSTKPVNRRRGR